jgi:hypothetical protein
MPCSSLFRLQYPGSHIPDALYPPSVFCNMVLCCGQEGYHNFFCSGIHTECQTVILCGEPSQIFKAIPSKPPSDHLQCKIHKWFRWADGLGHSPKASPTVTQSGEHSLCHIKYCTVIDYSLKATLPGPQAEPSVPEQGAAGTSKVTCTHHTCQIVCVTQFCQCCMCRKYCQSQGGWISTFSFCTAIIKPASAHSTFVRSIVTPIIFNTCHAKRFKFRCCHRVVDAPLLGPEISIVVSD